MRLERASCVTAVRLKLQTEFIHSFRNGDGLLQYSIAVLVQSEKVKLSSVHGRCRFQSQHCRKREFSFHDAPHAIAQHGYAEHILRR
jgi:hypothetical protein